MSPQSNVPDHGRGWRRGAKKPLVVLAGAAALLGGSPALASHQNTNYTVNRAESPAVQAYTGWGERSASAEHDFNGDGKTDVWVGSPSEEVTIGSTTYTNAGRVRLMNGGSLTGASPVVLRTITSPIPQAQAKFGFFISVIGDVGGINTKPEIAIGTDSQDVGSNTNQGKAWVFDGDPTVTAPLYALDNPAAQANSRFGSRIGRAGDVTGDAKNDLIVGDSAWDNGAKADEGRAYIFNGATGALVRTLSMPDPAGLTCKSSCGTFGLSVQGPGDSNGDGTPDQLVGAGSWSSSRGRMYLFSGATGALIPLSGNGGIGDGRINSPVPQTSANFGFQDVAPGAPGDVNGDGKADIYGNGFMTDGTFTDQGRAWVFNGATGAMLYEVVDPSPEFGGQFGWSMANTDYNHDGAKDLYVGAAPHHNATATGIGGMGIFKGSDGSLLKALDMPAPDNLQVSTSGNLGPNLGWSITAPGDLNGDGQEDYVAGAPFTDVSGRQDQGRVYVYVSGP